jgi:hypothetical protein
VLAGASRHSRCFVASATRVSAGEHAARSDSLCDGEYMREIAGQGEDLDGAGRYELAERARECDADGARDEYGDRDRIDGATAVYDRNQHESHTKITARRRRTYSSIRCPHKRPEARST